MPKAMAGLSGGPDQVSSPAATGGGGTFFEQHVNAHWLALLLTGAIPPILHDSTVVEVHFQTEHMGWNTDDFLVVAESGNGTQRRLAGQVKRAFTVSSANDDCNKALTDFWMDFKGKSPFSAATDRFALVVLRGTNLVLEHFAGLLDLARSAPDEAEFDRRLTVPGLVHSKVIEYCQQICTIVGEHEGRSISVREAWPLLNVLHVVSLDLNTPTQQTESHVKSLLALTTSERDAAATAEATWAALLREVGEGMPRARSYTRDSLPEGLRQRHGAVGSPYRRALQALSDHSDFVLAGITSTIGTRKLHLPRCRLVQGILDQLESSQIVLVCGPAGSGKSAVAKDVVRILAKDHFVFCLRAEELARSHLDEALHAQVSATSAQLEAVLAGQARKVLLVEGVERLLEAPAREALTDLLTLVARDRGWRLILTCRDYSSDLIRSCFLQRHEAVHAVVNVPDLDDDEVAEVLTAYPTVARPLSTPALSALMRNLYILDKALLIEWGDDRPLPHSEREFRDRFWRDIIRADDRASFGMPTRREIAFARIALTRARLLVPYTDCTDLDIEVLEGLRHDSLVVTCPQHSVLAAPAHDVLEDWAILRWIEEKHAAVGRSATDLAAAIGTYPALRRTFRKYVIELVDRNTEAADAFFQTALSAEAMPTQFRDDLLVALLQSPGAPALLRRNASSLCAGDKAILRRVIHLLRVACVKTPPLLPPTSGLGPLFHVPAGSAWPSVLGLVRSRLGSFSAEERLLVLGLIEDWTRGVSWQTPYPDGADEAFAIGLNLLSHFDDYRDGEQRRRVLQVLAKVPNIDPKALLAILRGEVAGGRQSRATEDMRDIVLAGIEGTPACRDLPDEVISVAREEFLCAEQDARNSFEFFSSVEVEPLFGIRAAADRDCFPPSAYRGPFWPLLQHHFQKGLDFILSLLDHSADRYAHPLVPQAAIEPPFELTLTFADGTTRKQWANERLWGLYRGLTVGPCVLQSALMSLEHRLLEMAEDKPKDVDALLLHILRQCSSAAVTAVVASVTTAHPHCCGETLLVLVGSPECVLLDRVRLSQDMGPGISGMLPTVNATHGLYRKERARADKRPHRRQDLENAVINLQLSPLATRVHQILDRHLAALPSAEAQSEYDRRWRLALHRMDIRQYSVADTQSLPVPAGRGDPVGGRRVLLTLNEPSPDLQEFVRPTASRNEAMNASLGLLNWGMNVFECDLSRGYDPGEWRERLALARGGIPVADEVVREFSGDGAGFVATVCVRDHWDEMSDDDRRWCVNTIIIEVERDADNWDELTRIQREARSGDRPSAWILPKLLGKKLERDDVQRVMCALAMALTHAIDEVRSNAAAGVADALWGIDRHLALRCVALLTVEAALVQQAVDVESPKPPPLRRKRDAIEAEVAGSLRPELSGNRPLSEGYGIAFDPTGWGGAKANVNILTILGGAAHEPEAREAYLRLADTLVAWWDSDNDRQTRRDRNYEVESALTALLVAYLLRAPGSHAADALQAVFAAVDRHVREIHYLLLALINREDRHPNTEQFWMLWGLFAERVMAASWLPHIDGEHAEGNEMVSAIFLGSWWKEGSHHWRSLDGHAHQVHSLFESLPPSATVLDAYVRFLYHVGERSLPEVFTRITSRVRAGDPSRMLSNGSTVILLERLLERHVYGRPLELKTNRQLKEAVLDLLELLVERGSSAAFRMRDDFVTPLPVS
jgi:hypothetical protein